jgi:hypothetical protein
MLSAAGRWQVWLPPGERDDALPLPPLPVSYGFANGGEQEKGRVFQPACGLKNTIRNNFLPLSAFQGSAFIANYAATKAFSLLIGEGLWEEWRALGVDVLVCLASAIKTPGYLARQPKKSAGLSAPASEPGAVAASALEALGKQPTIIPGVGNRMASFFMRHVLPRRAAIRLMGRVLRGMVDS